MGFKIIKQELEISSVNVRKENHGDEPVPAVDIRMKADDITADVLMPVLGIQGDSEAEKAFHSTLWDADGPRFSGLTLVKCWPKFEGSHRLAGDLVPKPLVIDKLHKFVFKPTGVARASVEFTVSIVSPPEHLLEKVASLLGEHARVSIEHDPELELRSKEGEGE